MICTFCIALILEIQQHFLTTSVFCLAVFDFLLFKFNAICRLKFVLMHINAISHRFRLTCSQKIMSDIQTQLWEPLCFNTWGLHYFEKNVSWLVPVASRKNIVWESFITSTPTGFLLCSPRLANWLERDIGSLSYKDFWCRSRSKSASSAACRA